MTKKEQLKGFTLLELLIVIAILSILAMALILVLNPAETMKKSRDTQRMTDLSTIKTAMGLYMINVTTPDLSNDVTDNARCVGGSGANTIFYSGTVTEPQAPATFATGFLAESTNAGKGNVDGSGWIPIDLTNGGALTPSISNFPLDPANNATNKGSTAALVTDEGLVYRYACNAADLTYEINANLESAELDDKEGQDGGDNATLYEVGTKLTILPSTADF